MEELRSLISYGEKIQVGADGIDNKLIPMPKYEPAEPDPEKESLKNLILTPSCSYFFKWMWHEKPNRHFNAC